MIIYIYCYYILYFMYMYIYTYMIVYVYMRVIMDNQDGVLKPEASPACSQLGVGPSSVGYFGFRLQKEFGLRPCLWNMPLETQNQKYEIMPSSISA